MKRNDKIILTIGVVILLLTGTGIYYWDEKIEPETATRKDILKASGTMANVPESIKVSNSNHFYAIIATPLAVNYDMEGRQKIIPLYVEDFGNPSSAVVRLQKEQLAQYEVTTLDCNSPKEFSLEVAKKYWESSDAVLLIKEDQEGYSLGVAATPIASYLSIPVIVTDEVCQEVREVLNDLDVKTSIICGDLEGYGKTFEFKNIDEIIDLTIELIDSKFEQEVNYITITNPRDAYPPKVLNSTSSSFSGKMAPINMLPSALANSGAKGGPPIEFKIPEDYKYAHVMLEIINQEPAENIEKFGDVMTLSKGSLPLYMLSSGSTPIVDSSGELKNDRLYYEDTYYDSGGREWSFTPTAMVMTDIVPEFTATVRIDKLDSPHQPLIKQLSSMAPYLTAYHKGIIFAKPEFAFANDDNVKLDGQNLPGTTTPRMNPIIIPALNKHVYYNVHEPINELLAKITDISISDSVKSLKERCYEGPFYIALVGDATMLPQYFYRNPHSDPYEVQNYVYGTNTPSDFIYGNIDPDDFSPGPFPDDYLENDQFITPSVDDEVPYPVMENIVGRITGGFDVQDSSALIARTVFYDDVLESLPEEWKNQAVVMSGAGLEFQKLPIIDRLHQLMGKEDPMKWPSGQQHFLGLRTQNFMEENGGFNVEVLERGQAQRVGFSKEALDEIKNANTLSKLLFPKRQIQLLQGIENVNSLFDLKWWRKAREDGSGIHGEESQENSNLIQVNAHGIWFDYGIADVMLYASGGPLWQLIIRVLKIPGNSGLANLGGYAVRDVSLMEMGPSVMFVECCGGGKIDSLHPEVTLSGAYLHAGLNAFICPSTFSAIGGYLEPRPLVRSFGLLGYITELINTKKGEYVDAEFCGWIFEKTYDEMFEKDATIGEALRNARNAFLPDQIDETYLWTPPLPSENSHYQQPTYMKSTAAGGSGNVPVEKYATILILNLLGDPMWNPYQPCNNG